MIIAGVETDLKVFRLLVNSVIHDVDSEVPLLEGSDRGVEDELGFENLVVCI